MSRRTTSRPAPGQRVRAALTAVSFVFLTLGLFTPAAATAAAGGGWEPMPHPWASRWQVTDITAFRPSGLAAVGEGGHIAVSRDGGATWKVTVPSGHQSTVFGAIAFDRSGAGVVASGGLLLVTGDGGRSWHSPTFVGPGPAAQIRDLAMAGSLAVAVGDAGVIVTSDDSGVTWHQVPSPTSADLVAVAIAGDGTVVAGASNGTVLTGKGDAWAVADEVVGAVTAAAAAPDPAWSDGQPDLLVATASEVLGSDDGLTFTSIAGSTLIYSTPWQSLAWVGMPGRTFLAGSAGGASFFSTSTPGWLVTQTGLIGSDGAAATGAQSVAYMLDADGGIARTLSAGRTPAVTGISAQRVTAGSRVRFTALVNVAAPGRVQLQRRTAGQVWQTAKAVDWTNADWRNSLTLDLTPRLNQELRVRFAYGGAKTILDTALHVVVAPRLTPDGLRHRLSTGATYRFSGSVFPRLRGERIGLYTDRGGSWRPVSGQSSVLLRDGRTWTSRRLGTPKAETYHLRAHISKTARHGEAWSRVVTVVVH
jgi:hypothetical protein